MTVTQLFLLIIGVIAALTVSALSILHEIFRQKRIDRVNRIQIFGKVGGQVCDALLEKMKPYIQSETKEKGE